jgi:hypothetical protein
VAKEICRFFLANLDDSIVRNGGSAVADPPLAEQPEPRATCHDLSVAVIEEHVNAACASVLVRKPPADPALLSELVANAGVTLAGEYVAFMESSDGAEGDVGNRWVEIWPVERVLEQLESALHYEGVVLFAGDGANTVFGFDRFRDGEVVEGDWIGLNRDELIPHGRTRTFIEFLRSLASGQA